MSYGSLNTAAVSVTSSVTPVAPERTGRQSLLVQNRGAVSIYVGTSAVTTATGVEVAAGTSMYLDSTTAAVYAISGSTTCNVRYAEVF